MNKKGCQVIAVDISQINYKMTQYFSKFIDGNKLLRINQYVNINDFNRALVGQALAKYMVSKKTGILLQTVNFSQNEYGKPQTDSVHFNISHSGDYVVCSIDDNEIGIDIEKVENTDINSVHDLFNEEEFNYIVKDKEQINEKFFYLWTRKESLAKAIGTGINENIVSYPVLGDKIKYGKQYFYFNRLDISNGYMAHLCRTAQSSTEVIKWDAAEFQYEFMKLLASK